MPVLISGDAALLRTIHANSLMFLFWRNLKLNWTLTLSECQAPNLSFLSAGVFERSPASKFGKLNKMTTKIKVNWIIDFEFLPIKRCYRGDDVIKKIFFSCSTKNDLTANTIYKVQSISSKASIFSFVPVMLFFFVTGSPIIWPDLWTERKQHQNYFYFISFSIRLKTLTIIHDDWSPRSGRYLNLLHSDLPSNISTSVILSHFKFNHFYLVWSGIKRKLTCNLSLWEGHVRQ